MRPHPKRTSTNPRSPRAWGTCDRSGFITNHEKLSWQFDWRGTRLENLRFLVAPDMLDKPQRQLGTIILPPDPVGILNARPEQYVMEEGSVFSLIQHAAAVSTGSTTVSVSLQNRPQQGNLVAVGVILAGSIGTAAATDGNNGYKQTPSGINIADGMGFSVFYLPDAPANAGKTITVTSSISMTSITVFAAEFAGPQATVPFDTEAFATGSGSGVVPITAPTIITNFGDLLFAVVGSNGGTVSRNAPWTGLDAFTQSLDAYFFQTSSGPRAAKFTLQVAAFSGGSVFILNPNIFYFSPPVSLSATWGCQIVGFKSWGSI